MSNSTTLKPTPVFLFGISKRCGTNFLHDLLTLHPNCSDTILKEDYLLDHIHLLEEYVKNVAGSWEPRWGVSDVLLRHEIGAGLRSFLRANASDKSDAICFLARTPSVRNLDLFSHYFPRVRLVILVRDGRSVVESYVRSFSVSYEYATRIWTSGARKIQSFAEQARMEKDRHCLIVRYEDLYQNPENELGKILKFMGLNPEIYDFNAASRMPVKGSSVFGRGVDSKGIDWRPVKKTDEFSPLCRWKNWNRARHLRFNWIAGDYLAYFGYQPRKFSQNPILRLLWSIWNRILDLIYFFVSAKRLFHRLLSRIRRDLSTYAA